MTKPARSSGSTRSATELHQKRGVKLDSFLFDDGWDDHASLWGFNSGFPNGFTPLTAGRGEVWRGARRLALTLGRL